MPFTSINDPRLGFLKDFANWLDERKDMDGRNKLSKETFHSLGFSARSLAQLIPYLLEHHKLRFVLTSKFQSDCLESRFSQYRQEYSSYHLTVSQVKASEKKIRAANSLRICGRVFQNDDSLQDPSNITYLEFDNLNIDFTTFESFSDSQVEIAVYFGGYILKKYKEKNPCDLCKAMFESEQDDSVEEYSSYFDNIDRGNLTFPSFLLVQAVLLCWSLFENYLEEDILGGRIKMNLNTLVEIFIDFLLGDIRYFEKLNICKSHPQKRLENLKSCILILSKTILNNLTKNANDDHSSGKKQMGKRSKLDSAQQLDKYYQ